VFIDSHAHLEGKRYDADRDEVLARAKQNGIEAYLAIGNGDGPDTADCGFSWRKNTTANPNIRESGRAWEFIPMKPASPPKPLIPNAQWARHPKGHCLGRNRPRLFLRSLAARNTESSLPQQMELAKARSCPSSFTAAPPTIARTRGTTA
jgi:hypothetical protein